MEYARCVCFLTSAAEKNTEKHRGDVEHKRGKQVGKWMKLLAFRHSVRLDVTPVNVVMLLWPTLLSEATLITHCLC